MDEIAGRNAVPRGSGSIQRASMSHKPLFLAPRYGWDTLCGGTDPMGRPPWCHRTPQSALIKIDPSRAKVVKNRLTMSNEFQVRPGPTIKPFTIAHRSKFHLGAFSRVGEPCNFSSVFLSGLRTNWFARPFLGLGEEIEQIRLLLFSSEGIFNNLPI